LTAIWLRARSELRSRLSAIVALALIWGVVGGVVIASAAGARRTETAYPRLIEAKNGLTLVADATAKDPAAANRLLGRMLRFPQVEESSRVHLVTASFRIEGRKAAGNVFPLASPDGRFGTTINGMKILEGRMNNPNAPDEIVPSFGVADDLGLHVGDSVQMVCCGLFGLPYPGFKPPPPMTLHVVGIGAAPCMFQPLAGGYLPGVLLTPAFVRQHPEWLNDRDRAAALVLRRGLADVPSYVEAVKRFEQNLPPHQGEAHVSVPFNQAQQTVGVQQATRAEAISLWVLALLVALAGIGIFAQALARQTFLESTEYPTLRSVGMSPNQLVAIGMIRAAVIGAVGALVAVLVGFLLSPLTPTGIARLAEPNPGFSFDGTVMIVGAACTLLVVVLVAALPAWRAARMAGTALGALEAPGSRRPSAVASFMSRASFPPSAPAGVRMAVEPGRGRTAVPVRTTMFGATLGVLALAAALVFGASLDRLVATPSLSGYSWDVITFAPSRAQTLKLESIADRNPEISAYAIGSVDSLKVKYLHALTLSMASHKGSVGPSIAEGRAPLAPNEIALGTETMRKLGVNIGDIVPVTGKRGEFKMRVVGRVAVPPLFFSFARPGQGAALSASGSDRIQGGHLEAGASGLFLRFAPGADQQAFHAELKRRVGRIFWVPRQENPQVHNLGGIGSLPLILAGIVALMAIATLAHTMITSIRRRRLDFAILKTLGFTRRQVSATVAWQATALASIALVIGIPLGVISGRWGWNYFADRLGVVPSAAIPIIAIILAIPVAILVANLLSVLPGRIASRLRPGPVLRSE
jgi:ABC-type lipoprotein release transport system permease subunit